MPARGDILLVDDDALVRAANADALEEAGFNCIQAGGVANAAALLGHRRFSLVVCDHDLPDGKGTALLERVASQGEPRTPVIYLTAAGAAAGAAASFPFVKATLAKPVAPEELAEAVGAFLAEPDMSAYPKLVGDEERDILLGSGLDAP